MFSEDSKAESKRVTVLLVDEMDLLITKKQQVGSTTGTLGRSSTFRLMCLGG